VHTRVRMLRGEALGAPDALLLLTLAMWRHPRTGRIAPTHWPDAHPAL